MLPCIIPLPLFCFFNKWYYLCCCNISFSCDADVRQQGCTFREKSISKHIFSWTPRGHCYWFGKRPSGGVWGQVLSLACVCVCLMVLLQCILSPLSLSLSKASVQVNNTTHCQKNTEQRRQRVSFSLSQWQNDFCHLEVSEGWKQAREGPNIKCHMTSNQ